jgi:hypothetical protein
MQLLRVGYLRRLNSEGKILPAGQCCNPDDVHIGAPPNGAEVFYVIYLMHAHSHPDPYGDHLEKLVSILDRMEDNHPLADDSDLGAIFSAQLHSSTITRSKASHRLSVVTSG